MDKEQDILQEAIQALGTFPGLKVKVTRAGSTSPSDTGEALLDVYADGTQHRFAVAVKRGLTKSRAGILLNQREQVATPLLIISTHIYGAIAELLREGGLCYLDTAGNCYLRDGSLFILAEGRKPNRSVKAEPIRAFQDAGLRLIFLLLLDADKANCTYRELAEMAGISRGAVGYVMSDLADLEYVIGVGGRRRRLLKRRELIEKWVAGYGETLRPKLIRGRFRFKDAEQRQHWEDISLESIKGLWGGEPAASLITNYLKPEVFSIYSDAPKSQIVRSTRLLPDPEGQVEVLGRFWNEEFVVPYLAPVEHPSAPPLLVYADLIALAAPRNLDTARLLYQEELAE